MRTTINGVKIPPPPTIPKNDSYKVTPVNLTNKDRTEVTFEVLPTKAAAMAFLYAELRNLRFPMAAGPIGIIDYLQDKESYYEDMKNWSMN